MKYFSYAVAVALLALTTITFQSTTFATQDDEHDHHEGPHDSYEESNAHDKFDQHEDHDDHAEQESITIGSELASEIGIATRIAGPGSIERHINAYGRLATPPHQIVQSRARFPGLIREIRVNVGDHVARDEVLAVIESNESLRSYQLRSPIEAVVQNRMANVGEITGDAPLFTLVNNSTLWAELKIFPGMRFEVTPGQDVHINHNGHVHDSTISSITPASEGQPFVLARVTLADTNGDMAPGDMVSAQIDAERVEVDLVVEERALQTIDEQLVVFVQQDDQYTPRALEIGRGDGRFTEVKEGLLAGERYVTGNSYLLKAELLKAGASHEH